VVAILPNRRGNPYPSKTFGTVTFERVQNLRERWWGFRLRKGRQSGVPPQPCAQLSDQMQMIWHDDRGIDKKSVRRMQPANRIQHNSRAVLVPEDRTATCNGCGQEIETADFGKASFAKIS